VIDSLKSKVVLDDIWDRVVYEANTSNLEGVHILSFFGDRQGRQCFAERIQFRHRLVWLQPEDQKIYEMGQFQARLDQILDFEEQWIAAIKPNDRRGALILPHKAFEARYPLDQVWQRCQTIRLDDDGTLGDLMQQIRGFDGTYYRTGGIHAGTWIDEDSRCFKLAKPQEYHTHSIPENNRWKFTWRIPAGFHYDVTDIDGRGFKAMNEAGAYQTYRIRANIDPHNVHRGGQ
jgi:hypothetical protein